MLGELEVQKRLVEKQQEEINVMQGKMSKLKVDNLKLNESIHSLLNSLHQYEGERREWQRKSDEAINFCQSSNEIERILGKKQNVLTMRKWSSFS